MGWNTTIGFDIITLNAIKRRISHHFFILIIIFLN